MPKVGVAPPATPVAGGSNDTDRPRTSRGSFSMSSFPSWLSTIASPHHKPGVALADSDSMLNVGESTMNADDGDDEMEMLEAPPLLSTPTQAIRMASHEMRHEKRACGEQRHLLMRVLDSVPVQLCILLLIAFDLCLTVQQIVRDITDPTHMTDEGLVVCTIAIVSILLTEVLLRILGLGPRAFFASWVNVLDLAVSSLSLLLELIVVAAVSTANAQADIVANAANATGITSEGTDVAAAGNFAALRVLRPLARILRVTRVGTRMYKQHHHMQTAARHGAPPTHTHTHTCTRFPVFFV